MFCCLSNTLQWASKLSPAKIISDQLVKISKWLAVSHSKYGLCSVDLLFTCQHSHASVLRFDYIELSWYGFAYSSDHFTNPIEKGTLGVWKNLRMN